jgi:energy-coupling factor transport system substrate-specific component
LSPIPIIPGAVHLRVFAFVPGVVALVFGRGIGFLAGYLGSIFWATIAGYWITLHTPVVDGVFVGFFTGWMISTLLRGRMSRSELIGHIAANRTGWYVKSAIVALVGGVVMAFFVGASLNVTTGGAVPWWAGFFTIGVVSDTLPMVIFIPLLTEPLLRITQRYTELPTL